MDINTVSVDHGHQPGLWQQQGPWPLTQPLAAARTTKVFGGHLIQKMNHSLSQTSSYLFRLRGRTCESAGLLYATLPWAPAAPLVPWAPAALLAIVFTASGQSHEAPCFPPPSRTSRVSSRGSRPLVRPVDQAASPGGPRTSSTQRIVPPFLLFPSHLKRN